MMRIPYKVYHLMYVTKLSCTCKKRIKGRKKTKRNKTKQKKLDTREVKKEIKINIIIYTRIYPPPKAPKT